MHPSEPELYVLLKKPACVCYKSRVHFKCDLTLSLILLFSVHIPLP